jgi:hypothetical protein
VCLLLLHHRTRSDAPLVLLANRDEAYARAFDSPRLVDADHGIVAPRDLQAGGTWLGRNARGLVAAITNRRGEDVAAGVRSRGRLVLDALRAVSAPAAVDWLEGHLAAHAYAGFHLLLADGEAAWVVRHRGSDRPSAPGAGDVFPLRPGAHVLTNLHEPDELPVPPGGEVRPGEALPETLRRLERLAADEQTVLPGGHRILKRGTERGTVCSALLAPGIFRFAHGVPGDVPFEAVAHGARHPAS